MATTRELKVSTQEFECVYRILITGSVESISEQRDLNDVLDVFETAGDAIAGAANGVPRMYSAQDGTGIELTKSQQSTLRNHINQGIGRFQAWSTRCIPPLLDRMESMTNQKE
jgi:hypothetical protein